MAVSITPSGSSEVLKSKSVGVPYPLDDYSRPPAIALLTAAQHEWIERNDMGTPESRFFGFAARHMLNMMRYDDFLDMPTPYLPANPSTAHVVSLQMASLNFMEGMCNYFTETHGVNTAEIFARVEDEVAQFRV